MYMYEVGLGVGEERGGKWEREGEREREKARERREGERVIGREG